MEYKTFKKLLLDLVQLKEDEHKLNDALKVFEPDFNYIGFGRYESLVLECLKEAMNDNNKDSWISYWLYERDGKFTKEHIIHDKDGKNLPLRNMRDLYNLINNPLI